MTKEKILQEVTERTRHYENIINDPMNGCPEDFQDTLDRIHRSLYVKACKNDITEEEFAKAIQKGELLAEKDFREVFGGGELQ